MKSYTDIEQSKKLAEFLPLESADMCYRIVAYNPNDTHIYQPYCFSGALESDIPCWSLAALLKILSDITEYSFELVFLKRTTDGRGDVLENIYRCSIEMKDTWNTEPIDAIFEMICWLK